MFSGAITALVTPFKDGKIDEDAYQNLIEWQIAQGIDGIVVSGTTGESPTLSHEEHARVFSLGVEAAAGKVSVMAGSGSNSTAEAISLAENAKAAGADAILVATPYYNKPNQQGLYEHYKAIHDAVEIPIYLYNIPGRSVIDMQDETIAQLAKLPNIVGNKDATGDLARVCSLRSVIDGDFTLLSGEDMTAPAFNALGGVGCISVTSNVAPKLVGQVQSLTAEGDYAGALKVHESLVPLHNAMFCDTSPIAAKYAVSLLGFASEELRLPMTVLSDEKKQLVRSAMQDLDLI